MKHLEEALTLLLAATLQLKAANKPTIAAEAHKLAQRVDEIIQHTRTW